MTPTNDVEIGSGVARQEGWLVSFIDILILLVTLFVLLLTYQEDTTDKFQQQGVDSLPETSATAEPLGIPLAPPSLLSAPDSATAFFNIEAALPVHALAGADNLKPRAMDPPAAEAPTGPDAPAPTQADDGHLHQQSFEATDTHSTATAPAQPHEERAASVAAGTGNTVTQGPAMEDFLGILRDSELRNGVEVRAHGAGVHVELGDSIVFSPASTGLTPGGTALLERLAEALNAEAYHLSVEGHTDNIPIATTRFPSNWELSTARAAAVARYLVKRGIPAGRIRAIGYADTRPRANNLTPEGRSRNRRVSLILQSLSGRN